MTGVQFFGNQRSSPVWAGDFFTRDHLVPAPAKIDAAQFTDAAAVRVVIGAAGAAQNATSVPVDALVAPGLASTTVIAGGGVLIPAGTTLYFGGAKVATLTADAKIGDTALTVSAIPTAVVDNDLALFSVANTLFVPSGTPIGRTYAERASNTAFGPAAVTDDEIFLTAFDCADARQNNDVELYRPGSVVKENYLPSYTTTVGVSSNEVQTLTFGAAATGGTLRLNVPKVDGSTATTDAITWNTTDATYLAAINTALDAATGVVGGIVATGAAPDTAITFTFSGTGYAAKSWDLIKVHTFPTSTTTATTVRTTAGGNALLTKLRSIYRCIVGVD